MKTRRFRSKRKLTRKLTRKSTRKHKRHTKRHTKRHYKGGGLFVRNTTKDLVEALIAKYSNVAKQGERISSTDCMYIYELQRLFEKRGCKPKAETVGREENEYEAPVPLNEQQPEYEEYHHAPEDNIYTEVRFNKKKNPNYANNPFLSETEA